MTIAQQPCPSADVLEGLAAGDPVSADIEAHVIACADCRAEIERIQGDNRFLRSFLSGDSLPPAAPVPDTGQLDIPGYQVLGEIHRGGQGVVYLARQRSTKRDVAIKIMRLGPFATLGDRSRFDREIETLGKLNHPNIVAVHDAGVAAGFHYFVMNYVDGRPLDVALCDDTTSAGQTRAGGVSTTRQRLAGSLNVFIKVCEAVHAAHLRGVIHRDLKPSNIRVDRSGEPFVLDFGLARSMQPNAESAMTQTGQFVGSLPWASPEQIEGASSKLDLRTDVYSLGAILFQVLTGKLPFDIESNLHIVFNNILHREPPRPSSVANSTGRPRTDEELDTIVLKCLSKERERRYQSAGDLARDLRRYLAFEPIEAKRDSAMYVLRKNLRRYRLRVAAAGTFVLLLCVFSIVMSVLYRRSAKLEQQASRSASSLADMLSQSNIEQGRMAGMLGNLEQAEQLLWHELLIRRELDNGTRERLNEPPGPAEAFWSLWELYRRRPCLRTIDPALVRDCSISLAEDRRSFWLGHRSGEARRINEIGETVESFEIHVPDLEALPLVHPRGVTVVRRTNTQFAVWRRGNPEPLLQFAHARSNMLGAFSISADGERAAALSGKDVVVWELDPLCELGRFAAEDHAFCAVALSSNGRLLAIRDAYGNLHTRNLETGDHKRYSPRKAPRDGAHEFGDLLFSPDDRTVADAWVETPGRIWRLDRQPVEPIELSARSPGTYRYQSFSPDASRLLVGDVGGNVWLLDAQTGQTLSSFITERVSSVDFSPNAENIWTSSYGSLRLWEATGGAGVRTIPIPGESLHTLVATPDGSAWLCAGALGRIHRVEPGGGLQSSAPLPTPALTASLALSPDGRWIAAGTFADAAYFWRTDSPDSPIQVLSHPRVVGCVRFSPDGERIATSCEDRIVRIWRVSDGGLEREFRDAGDRVPDVDFDPSGRRLAIAVRDGSLLLWDLAANTHVVIAQPSLSALRAVRFGRDGRRLYAAGAQRTVEVWDLASKRRIGVMAGHTQEVFSLDVSPNGEMLASGDAAGVVRLWHTGIQRPLVTLEGHGRSVMSLQFAPDGRSLGSVSLDGTIKIWDLGYYRRHIAGNVAAQLDRLGAEKLDAPRAAAWRSWAEKLDHPSPAPATSEP